VGKNPHRGGGRPAVDPLAAQRRQAPSRRLVQLRSDHHVQRADPQGRHLADVRELVRPADALRHEREVGRIGVIDQLQLLERRVRSRGEIDLEAALAGLGRDPSGEDLAVRLRVHQHGQTVGGRAAEVEQLARPEAEQHHAGQQENRQRGEAEDSEMSPAPHVSDHPSGSWPHAGFGCTRGTG
jgi:hypothetical protein